MTTTLQTLLRLRHAAFERASVHLKQARATHASLQRELEHARTAHDELSTERTSLDLSLKSGGPALDLHLALGRDGFLAARIDEAAERLHGTNDKCQASRQALTSTLRALAQNRAKLSAIERLLDLRQTRDRRRSNVRCEDQGLENWLCSWRQ